MVPNFEILNPVLQAALAGLFTWLLTLLGAAAVFLRRDIPRPVLDFLLGLAAGIMVAASFWSLLAPGIAAAEHQGLTAWAVAALGFLSGAAFLWIMDKTIPHLHPGLDPDKAEGPASNLRESTLLFLAMMIHNIPEGLAVGIGFGAAASGIDFPLGIGLSGAVALSLGIGLQNLPEGLAVSLPMRRAGLSRWKCFLLGQGSALVEPLAAVAGAALVLAMAPILPWALCFAAGAMIYVVIEELLPEAQKEGRYDSVTLAVILGFTVMMVLDVALG